MDPLTALTLASTGYSIYSSWKAGKEQAAAQRRQAEAIELQRKELRRRFEINAELESEKLQKTLGTIATTIYSRGMGGIEESLSMGAIADSLETVQNMRYEMEYEVKTLGMEAEATRRGARDIESASKRDILSSLLSGGLNYYQAKYGRG